MKDLRFLGRYLPEFRAIQALARHDYYHLYTVDEHILLAIKNLQALWSGSYPCARDSFRCLQGPYQTLGAGPCCFAPRPGQGIPRGTCAPRRGSWPRNILTRSRVIGDDRERVLFLIENHLVMALLSQRRELSDRKVIADFSRLVRDRENLAMLYLLTYADISAVNPTAWTQWKAALLQDLYMRTLNYLDRSAQTVEEERARLIAASVRIRNAAEGLFSSEEIDAFLVSMPEQYLLTASTHRVIDHMSMMKKLPDEQLVIRHRHYPERGYTELTVCAYDAYGMFYRTAGTIASKNLNILRAQVFTSKNGVMIDTFQITDPEGKLCDYEDVWESVRTELRAALMSGRRLPEPGPPVSPQVVPRGDHARGGVRQRDLGDIHDHRYHRPRSRWISVPGDKDPL